MNGAHLTELCSNCRSFFIRPDEALEMSAQGGWKLQNYARGVRFYKGASEQCPVCALCWDAIQSRPLDLLREWILDLSTANDKSSTYLTIRCPESENFFGLHLGLMRRNPQPSMIGTEDHVHEQAAVENHSSQRINATPLASNTSSRLRLEVIKTWMAECAHTHGYCHRATNVSTQPSCQVDWST